MNRNREVLKHCPHFYSIINFDYYSDDLVSAKLIKLYKNYIFSVDLSSDQDINKIEKLDTILYEYISDYTFRQEVKNDIYTLEIKRQDNLLDAVVNAIISFFDNYEKVKYRKVRVTRWI